MNDNGIDKQIEKMVTKKFQKWAIIGCISLFGFVFVLAFIVAVLQMFSIENIFNAISEALDDVAITIDSSINFLTGQGDSKNENEAYNYLLTQQYKMYHETEYALGELDVALIAATLNYGKLIDSSIWMNEEQAAVENDNEASAVLGDANIGYGSENSEDFYRWANIWVGNYMTVNPWNRGLIGALVSTETVYTCETEKPDSKYDTYDKFDYYASLFGGTIKDNFNDLMTGFTGAWIGEATSTGEVTGNTWFSDAVLSTYYTTVVEITNYDNDEFADDIFGYSQDDVVQETGNDECEPTTVQVIENGEFVEKEVETYLHTSFILKMDDAKYKNYLRTFFIPYMYLDCDNCSLRDKNWADGEKEEEIERIIEEIYLQKDTFNEFAGIQINTYNADNCPLDKETIRLTSRFGVNRGYEFDGDKWHSGIDFGGVTPEDEVYTVAPGTVIFAGESLGGYGKHVKVLHEDGSVTLYAHLSAMTVVIGDELDAGEQLGFIGSTGNSTANHLHFEIRTSNYGSMWDTTIDPLPTILEICGDRNITYGGGF